MKKFLISLLPPILFNFLIKIKDRKYGWHGDYKNWEEAQKNSSGYDSDLILQKVRNSLLKVKNGEAIYERDSVIFNEIEYSWPLLAGLMFSCTKLNGKLKVLDFGGSLGSSFYQNKKFFERLENFSWSIVEQKHFVEIGKKDFENEKLKFFYNIESCFEKENPNVLVISNSIQYLEKPFEMLDNLLKYNFEFLIFDRISFSQENRDVIKIQNVWPKIYEASYPCWFFNKKAFINFINSKGYNLIEEFVSFKIHGLKANFLGFIFERKK